MPGARPHPQPRVQVREAHERSHHGYTGINRHSLRDGFTVSFVLSSGTGLSCPRRLAKNVPQNLTSASGCQDHTTSPSEQVLPVRQCLLVHRISSPTFVTVATPLLRGRNGARS